MVEEQKVIWVLGDWEKGNVRGKLGLLKANFIFLILPAACVAWAASSSSSFLIFFQKNNSHESWGYSCKCLAQSLTLSPPHTLAQTPLYLLTGTGAPGPSWCSVLCSFCQPKLTFEMKPTPYACLRLRLRILYHDLSSRHPIILL